jgi:acetyltransferase-like isoleucine patch superfamily enzyme
VTSLRRSVARRIIDWTPAPLRRVASELLDVAYDVVVDWGAIRAGGIRARRFAAFGERSAICFPVAALFGERYMSIGAGSLIGPFSTLSAGVSPEQELDHEIVTIGNRCLIGKGSGIVGHERIVIGDDVFTGHHVYITDANHGYEDTHEPVGRQFAESRPVMIGDGSWLGHGSVVLPGVTIGKHVVVGAGSVVTDDLPDFSVAVGNPARVIRRYVTGEGWTDVAHDTATPSTAQPPAAGDG